MGLFSFFKNKNSYLSGEKKKVIDIDEVVNDDILSDGVSKKDVCQNMIIQNDFSDEKRLVFERMGLSQNEIDKRMKMSMEELKRYYEILDEKRKLAAYRKNDEAIFNFCLLNEKKIKKLRNEFKNKKDEEDFVAKRLNDYKAGNFDYSVDEKKEAMDVILVNDELRKLNHENLVLIDVDNLITTQQSYNIALSKFKAEKLSIRD